MNRYLFVFIAIIIKSDDKIILGDDCSEKMENLRLFFIAAGLKFGTDLSIDVYPWENPDE